MHEYTKQEQITILQGEIEVFKKRIDPNKSKVDILYLADNISLLEGRIKKIKEKTYLRKKRTNLLRWK